MNRNQDPSLGQVSPEAQHDQQLVEAWMRHADNFLDSTLAIRRDQSGEPGAKEYWQLHDAVYEKGVDDHGNPTRTAVAVLQQGTPGGGPVYRETVPVSELLKWQAKAEFSNEHLEKAAVEAGEISMEQTTRMDLIDTNSDQETEPKPEAALEKAKRLTTSAGEYDLLLGNNDELEAAIDGLSAEEKQQFTIWSTERAAKRTGNPFEIIGSHSTRTETGVQKIDKDHATEFIESLSRFGASAEAPTEDEVKAGIERAKAIIASGQAARKLAGEEFIDEKAAQRLFRGGKRTLVAFDGKAYINPELIKGSAGHDSWAGRGHLGQASVDVRELEIAAKLGRSKRSSIEQIEDYATRPTALPGFDESVGGGLMLIITDKEPVFIAGSAHRASAAKLRGEPLGFSSLTIYDARGVN